MLLGACKVTLLKSVVWFGLAESVIDDGDGVTAVLPHTEWIQNQVQAAADGNSTSEQPWGTVQFAELPWTRQIHVSCCIKYIFSTLLYFTWLLAINRKKQKGSGDIVAGLFLQCEFLLWLYCVP